MRSHILPMRTRILMRTYIDSMTSEEWHRKSVKNLRMHVKGPTKACKVVAGVSRTCKIPTKGSKETY